ncbi:hypothetical protein HPP92_027296 [Vanilla planifolia]|uniref:Uncharacterized protein n=1 Tax=Vanilla planifolia TaxID=51239 RepID=A0A835PC79_VANPL|nr:hypothetical protein HPP92_027296 [Vanilla planifolia]
MEATRRSALDRSREPGLKKPRLSEELESDRAPSSDRNRPFAQIGPTTNPRFRVSERDREDKEEVARGAASYQQLKELVAQYKTALSELTFNSKPIITNLTIIAGENIHAAKEIASTVCTNILEVPSEQKLPSLYLLDSIVKNIGRDYVKHFAARLPEVFCKAYKQVDPSVHPSMRHLFGTWKGVFPVSNLQIIEKDLSFPSAINGSSGGTKTRSDTQAQRPAHGIHVNPKYLEARQRLQQSTTGKGVIGEDNDDVMPVDSSERSVRIPTLGSAGQLGELSNKIPHPQRERVLFEDKGYKEVKIPNFSAQLSRQTDLGKGRNMARVKEPDELEKQYFGPSGAVESIAYRNGFDSNLAYGSYRTSGSSPSNSQITSVHLNSSNKMDRPSSKNWKNSEEEEYIWDVTGHRSVDYEASNNSIRSSWNAHDDKPTSLQSRKWMHVENEQPESQWNKFDAFLPVSKGDRMEEKVPLSRENETTFMQQHNQDFEMRIKKDAFHRYGTPLPAGGMVFSSRASGKAEERSTPITGALSTEESSSLPTSRFQLSTLPSQLAPPVDGLGSSRLLGQQGKLSLRSSSASLEQQQKSSLIDQEQLPVFTSEIGQNSRQLSDLFKEDQYTPVIHDSFMLADSSNQQAHASINSHASLPQVSKHYSSPCNEPRQQLTSLQHSQTDLSTNAVQLEKSAPISQVFMVNKSKGSSSAIRSKSPIDVSGKPGSTTLSEAKMEIGFWQKDPASDLQSTGIQPPLPTGPPPSQALTSSHLANSAIEKSPYGSVSAFAPPLLGAALPPLPPGPPPPTVLGSSLQTSNSASTALNPLSSLLSSLVAKGIISSTPTHLSNVTSSNVSHESTSQDSNLDQSKLIPPLKPNELSSSEPSTTAGVSLVQPTSTNVETLIGVQFKTEIVREFCPSVIASLLDDLKYQCNVCGLRFSHEEQLQSHLDSHKSFNTELSSIEKASRRWYSSIEGWVSGEFEESYGPVPDISFETAATEEHLEPMVTADESQSICALCGEPFEDFYSVTRDKWMYKNTVYLSLADGKCITSDVDETIVQGLIVHAYCISHSASDRDVAQ